MSRYECAVAATDAVAALLAHGSYFVPLVGETIGLVADLPKVRCDRGQMEQACLNLILNAAEAMPDGGALTISTAPGASGFVQITFTDTGVGMTPEQQARLFEPFLTTKERGTGLGLAIVQKIVVEAHRGRVEVESAPQKGTTFRVFLPV